MILQRYVMGEFLRTFAMIIGGLLIIYFSTRFASYLGQAADGKIAPAHIAQMLMLKMLVSMKDLVPMSLFLGIFGAIVRLQRDSELTAMRAAGAGPALLLGAALKLSVVSALIVGAITLYAEPRAEGVLQEIKDQTENEATIAGVKAGRFKEISGGRRIFYAEQIAQNAKLLEETFVQVRQGGDVGLMRSDRAFVETDPVTGDRFAVFLDGISYAGRPGALDYVITNFGKYALRIEAHAPTDLSDQLNYMKTGDLLKYEAPGFTTELQWRIAQPVAALLLPLFAVLIALVGNSQNWYLWLLTAVSGYFAYNNVLGVGKALMKKEVLPPDLGLWPVHLVLVATLATLWYWQRRRRTSSARRAIERTATNG
ncbi:MAG TPA: LPS export ABC transporter permease LptF [Gammaproteobacteria bacterium]|nr:LPS export ABC transporter permease LptF [Gammaproteobacteria bacterium]